MSESLREQYERETGKKAKCWNEGLVPASDYVAWLERRAACAEKLAEACKTFIMFCNGQSSVVMPERVTRAALAEYEAACKGESK